MKERILIVDDTLSWLYFHKNLIDELYNDVFEITLANSANEALNIVKKNIENPFDIIITDMQMEEDYYPKIAGEWLVENIKDIKAYYKTHIIIVSAIYNLEQIANMLNVECISKQLLVNNKLLMKFMLEKLMPFLTNL